MFCVVVDRHDVRVFQACHHLRFPLEAGLEVRILKKGRMQDFDGDVAVQRGVIPLVHGGHAALTELFEDAVGTDVFADGEAHPSRPAIRLRPL